MKTEEQIKLWAKEIKSISQTGLEYGRDIFDKERYEQLNTIGNEMLAKVSSYNSEEIHNLLPIETGYATPKIAVRGVVVKNNKILLVKEKADGKWCLPGGWCDVGLTPAENIIKEIEEETGLKTEVKKLLCIFDQTKHRPSITMQHIYTIYFSCTILTGDIRGSIETEEASFFNPDHLPPLSKERITEEQLSIALKNSLSNKEVYWE